ncbi:MAG TPA: ankyrin repeat domain-containing protein [Gammaproteobacteria bacterium]|nr:ankyrin repeat domain-containing protein [Gammaproteobacteria bacterium]
MAIDLNEQDPQGRTALHRAVIDKNPAAVKQLLSYGADPNVKDRKGSGLTPMWYAACQTTDPLSVMALKSANATVDQKTLAEIDRQLKADPINRKMHEIKKIISEPAERKDNSGKIKIPIK